MNGVGHISARIPGEQIHHTAGEHSDMLKSNKRQKTQMIHKNEFSSLTQDRLQQPRVSQTSESRSKSSCRQSASSSCVHSVDQGQILK